MEFPPVLLDVILGNNEGLWETSGLFCPPDPLEPFAIVFCCLAYFLAVQRRRSDPILSLYLHAVPFEPPSGSSTPFTPIGFLGLLSIDLHTAFLSLSNANLFSSPFHLLSPSAVV